MLEHNKNLLDKHSDILSLRELADSTVATYLSYLTQIILWVEENLSHKDISAITWEQIRSYIKYLKDVRSLSGRTINVHMAQLHDFFSYVLHRDWDKYEVPKIHFDEFLPIVPTTGEVDSIINSIQNPKHKAQISLLYSSGMRVSELCRLHCKDIFRSKNNVYISPTKNRSDRYAILSEKAFSHLRGYILTSYREASKEDWLFPGQREGTHVCEQTVSNVFKKAAAQAGLGGKGFNLHSLRHAFGLHLYEAGYDLMTIKEAMGHKSLSSTTVYLTLGIGNGRKVTSPYDLF